ncbi:MAG: reverse transcriptase family protein [Colwellia sp.]
MPYKYAFVKRAKRSISNIPNLLTTLDISQSEFDYVISLPDEERYKKAIIEKSDGSDRIVYDPEKVLRKVQRRINTRIFNQRDNNNKGGLISWPSYLYGSIPNSPKEYLEHLKSSGSDNKNLEPSDSICFSGTDSRDYIACASVHCGSKSILKMDISDFFSNIHKSHVKKIFSELLKFPDEVADSLTSICSLGEHVVQGALTSSYIASAVLFDIEPEIVKRLHYKKLSYTRLVDDMTVSSSKQDYDFVFAKRLISGMLEAKDLPVNLSKTVISRCSTEGLVVHGLRVNYKEPRLPSTEVARIRSSVKHLELLARDPVYRVSRDYRKSFDRCQGRVNKLGRLGHRQHSVLLNRVLRIVPLPSKKDIYIVSRFVSRLEHLHPTLKGEYRYARLFNRAHSELNILQRIFKGSAKKLRDRLKLVIPSYEK